MPEKTRAGVIPDGCGLVGGAPGRNRKDGPEKSAATKARNAAGEEWAKAKPPAPATEKE